MRIYLAGMNASRMGQHSSSSLNHQIALAAVAGLDVDDVRAAIASGDWSIKDPEKAKKVRHPWDLESYHYLTKGSDAAGFFRDNDLTIFLDSGAFSAFTQGVTIDPVEYAGWIKRNQDIIHVASNLDVIGGTEQASYDNQKRLEDLDAKVCPVHHARDKDEWLERYLADGYPYIFLGGMVPETTQYLREWLDRIWERYLTKPDGTARVKVHGFGLTTASLMWRYPWFSVDSTAWVMVGRYGGCYIDLPQKDGTIKDIKVDFSQQSSKLRKLDAHYDTFSPPIQRAIKKRVEEFGYNVDDLREFYGWRDHWNIRYYTRQMVRGVKRFKREQATLF